jgi:hypothetical protein
MKVFKDNAEMNTRNGVPLPKGSVIQTADGRRAQILWRGSRMWFLCDKQQERKMWRWEFKNFPITVTWEPDYFIDPTRLPQEELTDDGVPLLVRQMQEHVEYGGSLVLVNDGIL